MTTRTRIAAAAVAIALLTTTGCSVTRGQQTAGAYMDDTVITTTVKSRFADSHKVDATSISVETLNGTVMLSGFAKNAEEKTTAGKIATKVQGVRSVKNEITVRP
jgi:osmotically-inducible protein OsmY